jgi:hypothetical protein
MKDDILFIFDTGSVLIISDFFPRSDDPLGKRRLNIWSRLIELLMH